MSRFTEVLRQRRQAPSTLTAVLLALAATLVSSAVWAVPAGPGLFIEATPQGAEVKGAPPSRPSTFTPNVPLVPPVILGQGYGGEVEPNGAFATATPIVGTNAVIRGNVFPNGDLDWYSFTAAAGDRLYAAVMTTFSANASTDSQLRVFMPDGTTLIEFDDDDGSFGTLSSTIANATLASAGTYFLEVRHFSATNQLRPYELHFRLQSGAPTPEVEGNDTPATANPLPANGWVSGARNPAAATEQDWFSFAAAAGDTVFLSLDLDPERNNVQWNGRLGIALFGDANNQILVVDDASTGSVANPLSEAMFMTVKTGGTFFAFVDSASAAVGGPTATYTLSVSIHPAVDEGVSCTTYTSTNVPQTIGPGTGLVSSTITVPGNPRIADLDVSITLSHALMQDIDAHLRSPAGNDNGLFTDIGAAATGGQTMMDVTFDDEAGIPPAFTALRPVGLKPELAYRLSWFDGENAGGVWTLDLRDDTAGANGGTLTAWSLRICEPPPPPSCAPGFVATTVFTTDFEAGDAGFTHSGVTDEWERGLPTFAPITTCNSGVNCWKTDLDNTYNAGVAAGTPQDLLSAPINLAALSAPVVVSWAQRYQIENATFDRAFVDYQQVGGATPVRLWEWLDATMTNAIGNPSVTIQESSGWSQFSRRADSLAGLNTELRFNLTSDNTVQLAGLAIDDVSVTACRLLQADLSITKTDGVTTATPGGSVTYTITASNLVGPDPVTGGTVNDAFPGTLTCSWTCVGSLGGTCTAGPVAGNIVNDPVNLPVGASVTYTASCTIDPAATGNLVNTATVASGIVTDPTPGNDSDTDTDTLTPSADVQITKTDGVASATPGGSVTYTIVASNLTGPSDSPGSTVSDTFPGTLTCSWTCVGAGGGTCTAGPVAGNIVNDPVNLPVGGSVTYTASCAVSAAATGSLSNTATVTGGVTDPDGSDNSATDVDTLGAQADLSISKTDGLVAASPGQAITYTIVASNTAGPSNATGTVSDTFPAALTGATWTCVGAGGGTCTAGPVAGNIVNDPVTLPVGGSVTYTVNGTISGAFTGTLSNTASVAAAAGVTDPASGNNSATDNTNVAGGADVTGTKTVSGSFVEGGTIFYDVVLTNSGPVAQGDNPGDEFTDTLPAGLTLVNVTATSGTPGSAGNTATWNGSIPANGGMVTITIEATIDAGTGGSTINNQGTFVFDANGDGVNETTRTTDDPAVGGSDDPTGFVVVGGQTPVIPTQSPWGLGVLALLLGLLAVFAVRRVG